MKSSQTFLICLMDSSLQGSLIEIAERFGFTPQSVSDIPLKDQIGIILPDLYLIDSKWINETGHTYLQEIQEDFPSIWIYVLADKEDSEAVLFQSLKSGARGWIFKQEPEDLLKELKDLKGKGVFLKPSVSQCILNEFISFASGEPLLSIEEELLKSSASGLTPLQIEKKLGISKKFLKSHWESIWQKLNINAKAKAELEEFAKKEVEQTMSPKLAAEENQTGEQGTVDPSSALQAPVLQSPVLQSDSSLHYGPPEQEKKGENIEILQFVTFQIGKEEFALKITDLQEIQRLLPITSVPKVSSYIEGIVNLRGRIIPIIDLRKKLGFEPKELTKEARIMVIHDEETKGIIGMIVDSVKEVLRISSDLIQPPPSLILKKEGDYIQGIVNLEERLVLLVDTRKIISVPQSGIEFVEK
ncbi:MAG: chemotaxis protein CheW [Firmicutes bacterium]|nr:chemotaxis protein CheW [Bacillota bacterium]